MKALVILTSLVLLSFSKPADKIDLFNGKDLKGWDTWVDRKLNNDPDKIFSVVTTDGQPAIKISGVKFGGISTVEEYSNYHLKLEFKWGGPRYAPKLNDKRDSGLLYHGVGDHGADGGFWLRSQEFQIQEEDCGDYWGCAGGSADVPAVKSDDRFVYSPSGEMMSFGEKQKNGRFVSANRVVEKPMGEWNTAELYCYGDSSVHIMNGVVIMRLFKSRQPDGQGEKPLKKGKIQFQSEGSEIYYRKIELRKIDKMPAFGQ